MRSVSLAILAVLSAAAWGDGPTLNADIVGKFEWRAIGPASMGGRVSDIAVVESSPYTFYVGLATGGVIKTVNNGTTWTALFDEQPVLSIGAVAVAPSDPNVVWVGTGEANSRNSSGYGDGIYKSTDAGKTWKKMGLESSWHIARIVVDAKNPDIVFVAVMGRLWGPNPERGVYKTADGGKTWNLALAGTNTKTGAIDVAFGAEGVVFAALWERLRMPWGFVGVGQGAGLYRSTDGGETWKKLEGGLPKEKIGRIGISVSRSNPKIVLAVVESQKGGGGQVSSERSKEGGVFRSEDGGDTWTKVNNTVPRGFYFGQIRVDPKDDKKVYLLGTSGSASSDGGKTFRGFSRGVHADIHACWINPNNADHILLGCDGGVYVTYDGGRTTWDHLCNFPQAQFYDVCTDNREPFHVYGGLQDNGSWGGPSSSRTTLGVNNADWYSINSDGDGFYAVVNQENANIVYAESQNGGVTRLDRGSGKTQRISPSAPEGQPGYRFNWNTPLVLSPHNQDILYMGGNRLFKVWNEGVSWEPISPDLSKMDGTKITTSGSGAETYGTIVAVCESYVKPGLIWCGTDDGNVQLTRDGGSTWVNVGGNLPRSLRDLWISEVEASHTDPATAYVTLDGHRSDDFEPHVFVTHDYGATWQGIESNLPKYCPVQCVRESPLAPGVLALATSFGVYMSGDEGKHWEKLTRSMPNVEVDGLAIQARDMAIVAATHGRGIYILDSAGPLLQFTPEVKSKDVHLFALPTAYEYLPIPGADISNREFIARNPARGVEIYYWLKDDPKRDKPKITVTTEGGAIVYEVEGGTFTGLNSIRWDLREGAPSAPPDQQPQRRRGFEEPAQLYVKPGIYTVTLKVGERKMSQRLIVKGHPDLSKKPAE